MDSEELQYIYRNSYITTFYIGPLFICLSMLVIYTCRKGLKEKFIFQLFSWYLVSMLVFVLLMTVAYTIEMRIRLESERRFIYFITDVNAFLQLFSFISSWQWLNVIGFQIWSGYKEANAQYNSQNNSRRLLCYSIYVWGISAILTTMHIYNGDSWYFIKAKWFEAVSIIFNCVMFLVFSGNICITRCAVINLTTETRFKLRLASLILRLGLMMGLPRIFFTIFQLHVNVGQFGIPVFYTLEPFIMFVVLLWKPKNSWNLISCCCRNSEEISKAEEV